MKYHDSSVLRLEFADCVLLILYCHCRERTQLQEEKKERLFLVKLGAFSREKEMGFRERERSFLAEKI